LTLLEKIDAEGFALIPNIISEEYIAALIDAVSSVGGPGGIQRRGSLMAIRNLFEEVPETRELARSDEVRSIAEEVIGLPCFAVRGILFDKTPEANWKVAWHQDLTIAVKEKRDVAGFGPWSEKTGVPHVQPPSEVLERMITVRVHLDHCGVENGPVQVLPGSHRDGRLDAQSIERWRKTSAPVPCISQAGGAHVMRPLLLHASSPATSPQHRRVIHLDFAAAALPDGLEWYEQW
jgi:ectoine hydroxylase-related dioxygenase (phytanoyl-CoA dioxygenase family)